MLLCMRELVCSAKFMIKADLARSNGYVLFNIVANGWMQFKDKMGGRTDVQGVDTNYYDYASSIFFGFHNSGSESML